MSDDMTITTERRIDPQQTTFPKGRYRAITLLATIIIGLAIASLIHYGLQQNFASTCFIAAAVVTPFALAAGGCSIYRLLTHVKLAKLEGAPNNDSESFSSTPVIEATEPDQSYSVRKKTKVTYPVGKTLSFIEKDRSTRSRVSQDDSDRKSNSTENNFSRDVGSSARTSSYEIFIPASINERPAVGRVHKEREVFAYYDSDEEKKMVPITRNKEGEFVSPKWGKLEFDQERHDSDLSRLQRPRISSRENTLQLPSQPLFTPPDNNALYNNTQSEVDPQEYVAPPTTLQSSNPELLMSQSIKNRPAVGEMGSGDNVSSNYVDPYTKTVVRIHKNEQGKFVHPQWGELEFNHLRFCEELHLDVDSTNGQSKLQKTLGIHQNSFEDDPRNSETRAQNEHTLSRDSIDRLPFSAHLEPIKNRPAVGVLDLGSKNQHYYVDPETTLLVEIQKDEAGKFIHPQWGELEFDQRRFSKEYFPFV